MEDIRGYYALENRNYSSIARESKLRKWCSMFCKQPESICLVVIIFSVYWNTTISTLYSLLIYKGPRRFVTILASVSTEWVSLISFEFSTLLLSVISNGQVWLSNATWRCDVPPCRTDNFQLQRGYLQQNLQLSLGKTDYCNRAQSQPNRDISEKKNVNHVSHSEIKRIVWIFIRQKNQKAEKDN